MYLIFISGENSIYSPERLENNNLFLVRTEYVTEEAYTKA